MNKKYRFNWLKCDNVGWVSADEVLQLHGVCVVKMINFRLVIAKNCRYFSTQNRLDNKVVEQAKPLKRGPKGYTEDGGHVYPGFTYYPRY